MIIRRRSQSCYIVLLEGNSDYVAIWTGCGLHAAFGMGLSSKAANNLGSPEIWARRIGLQSLNTPNTTLSGQHTLIRYGYWLVTPNKHTRRHLALLACNPSLLFVFRLIATST